jgi:hypothetical protein
MKLALSFNFLKYILTAALAVPIGAIIWFEILYLYFGITAKDPSRTIIFLSALIAFSLSFVLLLIRSQRPVQVLRRACFLGLIVSILLPLVAYKTFVLIESASSPQHKNLLRDIGEGGMIFSGILFFSFPIGVGLVLVFALGYFLAGRRLKTKASCQDSGV